MQHFFFEIKVQRVQPAGRFYLSREVLSLCLSICLSVCLSRSKFGIWNSKKASHFLDFAVKNLEKSQNLGIKLLFHMKKVWRNLVAPARIMDFSILFREPKNGTSALFAIGILAQGPRT